MSGRIAVALSGGVDSAAAAMLLDEKGWTVEAVHLRLWPKTEDDPALQAEEDAESVAKSLGIPFHLVDLTPEFQSRVIETFICEYLRGRTPNPCVICNPRIKLGRLLEWAMEKGYDGLATGHYAEIARNEMTDRWELRKGLDPDKDQSYYLHRLSQDQLARFHTPLAKMHKGDIRKYVADAGLDLHEKSESQEICFIPDNDYRRFLEERSDARELPQAGPILDMDGKELGRHPGIHHFTIGQRRGIGLSAPEPLYVVALDVEREAVIVGSKEDLLASELEADEVVWSSMEPTSEAFRGRVKVRYRSPALPATIYPAADAASMRIVFDEVLRAITPGQSAVVYDMDDTKVLCGGFISVNPVMTK
ncbi:MAG: tRNA 2-thiouridine(34) synthase MnmA [Candidatus Sumerlaeia bacterium]